MIGYVIPDKGELKVREYEIYTGYYCGICKYIGRTYGQLPRMALSYDAAFIALLLASVDPAPDEPRQEHCAVHHIRTKTVIRNKAIEYAGDLMLILAWFKFLDDARDEGKISAKAGLAAFRPIWKKLRAKHPDLCRSIDENLAALNRLERENCPSIDRVAEGFAIVMAEIFRDGATWLYGPADGGTASGGMEDIGTVSGGMEDIGTVSGGMEDIGTERAPGGAEPAGCCTDSHDPLNGPAAVSGADDAVPGEASSEEPAGNSPDLHETFAKLGYHLGKWIYLIDAADDIEENIESGSYNPLLYRFGYRFSGSSAAGTQANGPAAGTVTGTDELPADEGSDAADPAAADTAGPESPEAFRMRIDEQLRFNLFHYLAVISESVESLDIRKNSGIIENVVYFGLNRRTEEVLKRIKPEKRVHGRL